MRLLLEILRYISFEVTYISLWQCCRDACRIVKHTKPWDTKPIFDVPYSIQGTGTQYPMFPCKKQSLRSATHRSTSPWRQGYQTTGKIIRVKHDSWFLICEVRGSWYCHVSTTIFATQPLKHISSTKTRGITPKAFTLMRTPWFWEHFCWLLILSGLTKDSSALA